MMMLMFLEFVLLFSLTKALEIIPERAVTKYFHPKYFKSFNTTIRRTTRNSPYTLNIEFEALYGVGDNLTIENSLLENLSGHYQSTLFQTSHKLCHYLQKEPYLGKMIARQMGNSTCPFAKGEYHFKNMVINVDNFKFTLPFTWAAVTVKTRADTIGYFNVSSGMEKVFYFQTFTTIIQKPKKT